MCKFSRRTGTDRLIGLRLEQNKNYKYWCQRVRKAEAKGIVVSHSRAMQFDH